MDNDIPGIVSEDCEWNPLQRLNSAPRLLLEIQTTLPHGHSVLISAHDPILVVTMSRMSETFKTVINEITHRPNFNLVNMSQAENANLTHQDLNTTIDEPEHQWNIHLVLYDTLTSRAKLSSNGQVSHCSWSFGIFVESSWYRTKQSMGWRIATHARIRMKL
jgi:hypothetical protein